jgi:diguanylate cyclase (GGDEF)-like protein/PAS domain S-box-containing protein
MDGSITGRGPNPCTAEALPSESTPDGVGLFEPQTPKIVRSNNIASCRSAEDEQRYRYTITLSSLVAWTASPDGMIYEIDQRGLDLVGMTFDQAKGSGFFAAVHPRDRRNISRIWRRNASLGYPVDGEVRIRLADGSYRWHRSRAAPLRDKLGSIVRWYGTIEDIHHVKLAADEVRWAAEHDGLTGLPNRTAFYNGLEEALANAAKNRCDVALLLFDLDNFKQINDRFGHDVGDAVLTEVALRIKEASRNALMVGRLGGDEFALFLACKDKKQLNADIADVIAAFETPFRHETGSYNLRSSVGAAIFPSHGTDGDTLRKNADLALYDAKAAGGGKVRYYRNEMRLKMQQRLSMLAMARHALEHDWIMPYYQPKVDLRTGQVTGFEALLRWNHDGRGLQLPGTIAAAFDDPELAVELGQRMQDRVIADLRSWLACGVPVGRVAINVSALEFRRRPFAQHLLRRLIAASVPPTCIEIEITEAVYLDHDIKHAQHAISELCAAGITIALDDFGTGYASLAHLRIFPVHVLKIDRSFVEELSGNHDGAIVRAIIGLGQSLGITTVAEGVETAEQRDYLLAGGCDVAQGFLYSAAVPMIEVAPLLTKNRADPLVAERRSGADRRH